MKKINTVLLEYIFLIMNILFYSIIDNMVVIGVREILFRKE